MALFFMVALPALAQEEMRFDKEPLLIQTAAGKVLHFTVEIASTPDQRARGLMFRKTMADDAGMIFDFDQPRRVTMWMENTILPLDMLFADDTGTIRHIKEKAVPYSRDIIDLDGCGEIRRRTKRRHRCKIGNQAWRQDRQRHDDEEGEVTARAAVHLSKISGY
ncbi:DUF192 domain-containing protein [Rhizobium laguerreae]|uniref:DUF192 domain-containing protein n=1 Tax=Rhizobium laguerreae TaxID=1076926 RepID=UPI003AADCC26